MQPRALLLLFIGTLPGNDIISRCAAPSERSLLRADGPHCVPTISCAVLCIQRWWKDRKPFVLRLDSCPLPTSEVRFLDGVAELSIRSRPLAPCRFFRYGRCHFGGSCYFYHASSVPAYRNADAQPPSDLVQIKTDLADFSSQLSELRASVSSVSAQASTFAAYMNRLLYGVPPLVT